MGRDLRGPLGAEVTTDGNPCLGPGRSTTRPDRLCDPSDRLQLVDRLSDEPDVREGLGLVSVDYLGDESSPVSEPEAGDARPDLQARPRGVDEDVGGLRCDVALYDLEVLVGGW